MPINNGLHRRNKLSEVADRLSSKKHKNHQDNRLSGYKLQAPNGIHRGPVDNPQLHAPGGIHRGPVDRGIDPPINVGGGTQVFEPPGHTQDPVVQALSNRGIQSSYDPHPGEMGWEQYSNGLWVYAPRGPGQPDPLEAVRGDIASLTDPHLNQTYKDQALSNLQAGAPPTPDRQQQFNQLQGQYGQPEQSNPLGSDKFNEIVSHIRQMMADRGQDTSTLPQQPQTAPINTSAPVPPVAAPIPTPTPTTPVSAPSPVDFSVSQARPTNPNQLGNRNIPGFASVRRAGLPGIATRLISRR